MSTINNFPIQTKKIDELENLTNAQSESTDRVIVYDESIDVWKSQTLGELFKGKVIPIDSIAEFPNLIVSDFDDRQQFHLNSFAPNGITGGGALLWDPNAPKLMHDGIRFFSPTVPIPADFDNPTDVQNYRDGVGEEFPADNGIFALTVYSINSTSGPVVDGQLASFDGETGTSIKGGPIVSDLGLSFIEAGSVSEDGYAKASTDNSVSFVTKSAIKIDLDINNVDNTSDEDKPISDATQNALDLKAPLASPAFTGNPTAPTPPANDNDNSIATTAYVQTELLDRPQTIESVASLNAYAPTVGQIVNLTSYILGLGKGGGPIEAKSGVITPNNVTTFSSATAGVYFERINVSRWNSDLSGGDLNLLFTYAPDGEVYITGESTPADITVTRNNLKIVGGNKPSLSSDGSRLENGTIIRGRLILGGNNCALINCGVDRGEYVTDTFFGGVAADALVVHDVGLVSQKTGNSLSDVIALVPNSVAFHACLYEKQEYGFLKNVRGIGGEWGVVIKGQHITFDGLSGGNNTQGGVVIKSDSYAPCTDIVGANVDTTGTTSGVGFYCYAATEQMQNVVVTNILTNGSSVGAKFVCSDRASYTNPMNDCTFDNIVTRNAVDFGVETFGALTNVNFGSVSSSDTVSGKSFRLDDNALDVHVESIKASAPAAMGSVPADAVYLAGRFFVDKVQSVKGYDLTSLQGVTVVPDANRVWSIGTLIGDCNLNKDASALLNGWTGAFGSIPRATLQGGKCVLSGRLAVPATPWTGKEVCYNVGVNMAPTVEKYFTTTGYDATAIKFVPIFVTVKVNGDVEVSQLTTASSFPATIAWIGFDLLEWDVSNLSV